MIFNSMLKHARQIVKLNPNENINILVTNIYTELYTNSPQIKSFFVAHQNRNILLHINGKPYKV